MSEQTEKFYCDFGIYYILKNKDYTREDNDIFYEISEEVSDRMKEKYEEDVDNIDVAEKRENLFWMGVNIGQFVKNNDVRDWAIYCYTFKNESKMCIAQKLRTHEIISHKNMISYEKYKAEKLSKKLE